MLFITEVSLLNQTLENTPAEQKAALIAFSAGWLVFSINTAPYFMRTASRISRRASKRSGRDFNEVLKMRQSDYGACKKRYVNQICGVVEAPEMAQTRPSQTGTPSGENRNYRTKRIRRLTAISQPCSRARGNTGRLSLI